MRWRCRRLVRVFALVLLVACSRPPSPRISLDLDHLQDRISDLRERVALAIDEVGNARNNAQRGAAVGHLWDLQRELADVGELVAAAQKQKDHLQPRP